MKDAIALVSLPLLFDQLVVPLVRLCSPYIVREKDDDETSPFRLSALHVCLCLSLPISNPQRVRI